MSSHHCVAWRSIAGVICLPHGGEHIIETRDDHCEIGVCEFTDNSFGSALHARCIKEE
jgi:hypothetical protein